MKEDARFCPNCGWAAPTAPVQAESAWAAPVAPVQAEPLPEPIAEKPVEPQCKNCGTALKEGAAFCPECGTAVAEAPAPAQAESVQKPLEEKPTPAPSYNAVEPPSQEAFERTKNGLIAAIVIGVVCIAVSIGVGYSKYDAMGTRYYSTLQKSQAYDRLLNVWGIDATSIKVGNKTADGTWLTNAGGSLSSSNMRFFTPVITYNAAVSWEMTFYVKIVRPNGSLMDNASTSPKGYSYSSKKKVSVGSNQTLELTGWGNNDRSNYEAGEWTVEVWYNNARLRSEKVRIN
jgi:RNA polymerase subunit RPABC4/transcription elongation factor Spt4